MKNIKDLFELNPCVNQKGVQYKNNLVKRQIVAYMAVKGECAIATLAKHINISIPSITKLVLELVADGIVSDNGKISTEGGRRPNIYGLSSSSMFFIGVYVGFDGMSMVVTDLHSRVVASQVVADFVIENTQESFDKFFNILTDFIEHSGVVVNRVIGMGVSMAGRVNPALGINYAFYTFLEDSLAKTIEDRTGIKTLIENDVRAKCYAEYFSSETRPNNAIFLELGMGVAVGIIVNGELCYGKSGFAGEFGHIPFSDNDILCYCGKKGCLETEISGKAIERNMNHKLEQGLSSQLTEKYKAKGRVNISDIVDAALEDDHLAIETFIEVSEKVGRSLGYLLNVFNPETVVIGGSVARVGEHILLPIKSAVNKYSLKLVAGDTEFRISDDDVEKSALGAAMLIRKHILGL
ncbi:MAG: ROK family protein [Rikenellaceae bacterium]